MRNLVENHIEEFSEILKYDKSEWDKIWKRLKKRFSPILDRIEEKLGRVSFEKIERRALDSFVQEFGNVMKAKKEKVAEKIRKNSDKFKLSAEDFVIFVAFAPFNIDWIVVKGKKENVIFFNAFSLWNKNELKNIDDAVYQAVVHFRHGDSEGNYYNKEKLFDGLTIQIKNLNNNDVRVFMKDICKLLFEKVPYYDWVGFYMLNNENLLELTEFVGEPTEHVKIPIGKGICGQAAERKITFVVQDVTRETNYLSCSPKVKSEIVVPMFKNGEVIGEIDIDSHYIAPFDERDTKFLEFIGNEVSKIWSVNLKEG
ncbi:MAG: GAF domain-containing protein [Thermosipho sp. (in: Bacteria)]|nr:GAF domain-containing protein [Thermosipho sp. (in: thermotogales)]